MDSAKIEVWKNTTAATIFVTKIDRRGNEGHEIVNGFGKLTLTVDERLINQDNAASKELDVFSNGMLVPIRLVEDSEGAAEIAASPNIVSEDDMKAMFRLHWKQFGTRISSISSPLVLGRMLAMTETEEVDATVKQVQVIKERLNVVEPNRSGPREDVGPRVGRTSTSGEHVPNPVTPR